MIIIMEPSATSEQIKNVVNALHNKGFKTVLNHGDVMTVIAAIGDKRLIRLIRRFLKVGIMENGNHITSEYGTPQRFNTKSCTSKYRNVLWNYIIC